MQRFHSVMPSIIIIEIISGILKKFKESQVVKDIFYGLRPASSALVSASGMAIARVAFLIENTETILINWKALILGSSFIHLHQEIQTASYNIYSICCRSRNHF